MVAHLVLQAFVLVVCTWALRVVYRKFVARDPLSIVPGPPSDDFLLGNMKRILDKLGWDYHDHITERYGGVFRITGLFRESLLYVHDPKALHHILIKDTDTFEESDDFLRNNARVFGMGLPATMGEQHKKQRKMLNPVFSPAHMRKITPIVYQVVHKLRKSLAAQVSQGETEINLNAWMTRTALEIIGQAGLGYSFDTLEPDAPVHPYAASMKNLPAVMNDTGISLVRMFLLPYVFNLGSPRFQRAVVDLLPWKKLHELRDLVDIMHHTSVEIYEATKASVVENQDESSTGKVGGGKDIMSVLVQANMSASEQDRLTDEELIGQISYPPLFSSLEAETNAGSRRSVTFAAMDTTSNMLSRILDILSERPEAQARLRQEIIQAYEETGGRDLDYDELNALPFLDAVCKETLRLHTPTPYAFKQVQKDGILPFSTPMTTTDNHTVTEIFVPSGTGILVSMHHCNRNPAIWGPDATEWKPERWLAPLPETVAKAKIPGVYANLMTFLGGSRSCIGFKFSELEMKVVLSLLVKSFHFSPSGKKIVWLWNGIVQPTTEDAPLAPSGAKVLQLPLKVKAV